MFEQLFSAGVKKEDFPIILDNGPGLQNMVRYDASTDTGFFGPVDNAEMPTFLNLENAARTTLLGTATNRGSNNQWVKYYYKGKVLYIPMLTIRSGITWNNLYQAGLVFGTDDNGTVPIESGPVNQLRMVSITDSKGKEWRFRIRLMRGFNVDPVASPDNTGPSAPGTIAGSEHSTTVERTYPCSGVDKTWASYGNPGGTVHLQESWTIVEGGVNTYNTIANGNATANQRGRSLKTGVGTWHPVLELIGPVPLTINGSYTKLADATNARSTYLFATVGSKSYAFGGSYGTTFNNTMDEYNHATSTWASVSQINPPTARCAMISCVYNNKIYMFGGQVAGGTTATSAVFDPATRTWTALADMPTPQQWGAAAAVGNKIYIFGGYSTQTTNQTRQLLEYDVAANTYRTITNAQKPLNGHGMVNIDGLLYIFGGVSAGVVSNDFLTYDPAKDVWRAKAPTPFTNTYSAYTLIGRQIYVFGGSQNNAVAFDTLYGYDSVAARWESMPKSAPARHSAGMVNYSGNLYLMGGSPGPNGTLLKDFYRIA